MTLEAATQLETYLLDPGASRFTVQAFAEGLLSAFGHDPVIGIKDFSGEVKFTSGTFADASLKLIIRADSLVVIDNAKPSDRAEIERVMHNEVLETGRYREIGFESDNVTVNRLRDSRYGVRLIGDLTLHGITQKNLWINAEATINGDELRATGGFLVKQSDFNIKRVSIAGGAMKVKNEVKCVFDLIGRRQTELTSDF
jgi:polyisoprenoid-binding protein YceI